LVCIAAKPAVAIYQTICSAVFSCLDWRSSAFILCLVNVNHDLVSGVPMQMPIIMTITMIMAMSVGKKFR
jgi:hypothetical protein